ncbi:phytoene/squalene synthase family protein [Luteimonas deserti]|uniref:Phytoene/squalene synthase family protein n=1 Tax=Luteimonas deserti TaxID=2752306 RepID=A0A7Z0QSS5_9GAMM|nr:phytoene/squalene synthase family protein [Luteimonas deserti]NYZ64227.1 phytoene/squalene synthase family protein [Luteimonas deserti]
MTDEPDFIDKWRRRWPEWRVGLVFVAAEMRPRAEAWFALLDEVYDAAWGGADPTPGLAKLAWWQEELQGWARGARRHPLAAVLQRVDAPWQTLALALRLLPATRTPSGDHAGDTAALRDLSLAIDACEARLFLGGAAAEARGVAPATVLGARAWAQADPTLAAACLVEWPTHDLGTRPRRIANAIQGERLRALRRTGQAGPAPGLAVLRATWRAARGR